MSEANDILDLCRLNLMEEHIEDGVAVDKDSALAAIDYKRRQIMTKMDPSPVAPGAMERHIEQNTVDGVYPWTEGPRFKATVIRPEQEGKTTDDHRTI